MSNPDTTRIFNYPEVTTPAPDAKILLDSQTVGSKCIDANLFRCDLIDKTITQRGTFEASEDDADGFKKVVVDIPYTDVHVASGPIATFDGEDLPLKSLTVSIEPVQAGSGDPSPTNVRHISGHTEANVTRCGKNLFSYNNGFYNIYYTYNTPTGDGSFVTLQNAGGWKSVKIKVEGLSKITISGFMSQGGVSSAWLGSDDFNDIISTFSSVYNNGTKQVPSGAKYLVLGVYNIYTNYETYPNAQIEADDTATTYEPYAGKTTTIPFTDGQGQSVEVFGGSVDVVNGGEQQRTLGKIIFDGSSDENWLSYAYGYYIYCEDMKSGTDLDGLCNMLTKQTSISRLGFKLGSNNKFIYINQVQNEWGISDVSELRSFLSEKNLQFTYPLATPTTFYTQPTSIKSLDGENNIYANTGDVDVEYQTVWVRPTE